MSSIDLKPSKAISSRNSAAINFMKFITYSGLPVNLYLDDSGSYLDGGHGPRIKFQPDKGNSPNTRSMIPMTISDEPTIPLRNYQSRLDGVGSNDISLIMSFVIANKANLLRLCDRNDEYDISNFLEDMVKVS